MWQSFTFLNSIENDKLKERSSIILKVYLLVFLENNF